MFSDKTFSIITRNFRWQAAVAVAFAVLLFLVPSPALGQAQIFEATPGLPDFDARTGSVAPTFEQIQIADSIGATARWNRFGTPQSVIKYGGYLATGLSGDSAVTAARSWIDANKALFGLASIDGLTLYVDSKMAQSNGHAVNFRQVFGGLPTTSDGVVTVGIVGTPESGWNVAYVSSSLTGDTVLGAQPQLSAVQAWAIAAASVGRGVSLPDIAPSKTDREWTVFGVSGFTHVQRARLVALPTPTDGVRPAFETVVLDNQDGSATGYRIFVDAENGSVLVRENLVRSSHPPAAAFTGTVPQVDGACDIDQIPGVPGGWTITSTESVASIDVVVEATITANDSVIHLVRNGVIVASQDTLFSPEAIHYAPAGGVPSGTYQVRVCDFSDGVAWDFPNTYAGTIAFNSVAPGGVPFPPKWKVFPAYPTPPTNDGFPWSISSTDIRKVWCWDSVFQGNPIAGCEDEVKNLAARIPWDSINAGQTTFTTVGNAADSSESWSSPLTPGASGFRPQNLNRDYNFPWTNVWKTSGCFTPFATGVSHDISAAVLNLFAMHNRMHDWSYHLGFTEENWNGQRGNFGNGGMENDALEGDAQAGALTGGFPGYLGRDNANMVTVPDGVPSITNMYLWQPVRGSWYGPCVDGDYDMNVIGHEYGHMIENRMIGKGGTRSGHHAGAMGESSGDLLGVSVTNDYGFVPVGGENPFLLGAYVTGSKTRGIRNYAMNQSPLNFSNMGYDAFAADPVHANGEIWSATNFDIRQALIAKYNASFPASDTAMQRKCAEGLKAPEDCPGNRRWIQIMFDAYLIMPVAPTMLDARDAYLAADTMRFGGANQAELWLAFARRGFGQGASSSNANSTSDHDPTPDFASPLHSNATVTFNAVAPDEGNGAITTARIYVGHYEARVSPIADTNPATNAPSGTNNLDTVASFAPGTYEFVAHAPGYGHVRFTRTFTAGQNTTLNISMPTNWASSTKSASASGDFSPAGDVIDDKEGTNATASGAPVNGKQVTVVLNGVKTINRVQVSASLNAQNRFTALRQFEIWTCNAAVLNCSVPANFTKRLTSPADAFPGMPPRPVLPEMLLRSFALTSAPVSATHVRLVVLTNQCTGQTRFQGVQDNDPLNPTDCRNTGTDPGGDPTGAVLLFRDTEVRAAELQVFGSSGTVTNGATLTLSPQTASNPVGTQHCVTATLVNGSGSPIKNATIRFSVTGANTASSSGNTNNSGQRTFCYTGTNVGNDTISAYADLNKNGVQDNGEPGDTASKMWVPPSTAGCEVKITNGGMITAMNGDPASFGGNATGLATGGASGQEEYHDLGPEQSMNVHSINVQSVTCNELRTMASIFGQATIDGSGVFNYQIDVVDMGEPGTSDKYRITLNGYDSGSQTLRAGNVQIH